MTGRPAVSPLDPDSPQGRAMAERLTATLADLMLNVEHRRREAARATEQPTTTAA